MKTTQIVLLLFVLVVLAGGVAFVKQWFANPPVVETEGDSVPVKDVSLQAYFPVLSASLETDVEVTKSGQFDFPFENRHSTPLLLGLDKKGCTCERVDVCLLTPEEGKKWPQLPEDKNGKPEDVPESELKKFPKPPTDQARWANLEESKPLTVEPGSRGWARLGWSTKTVKPVRLRAALWMEAKGRKETRGDTILEVLANVVPAVQVQPTETDVGEIRPGAAQSAEYSIWSSTRPALELRAEPEFPTPCITCKVSRMTDAQCRELEKSVEKATESKTRARCGYTVHVDLRDRVGEAELDLGPFERRIFFRNADGVEAVGIARGIVRGDVRLINPEHEDLIRLGKFRHDLGTTREVPLEITQPGMELSLESWQPSFMKVTLRKDPDEPGRWLLRVEVPPKTASGVMPRDAKVVLRTGQAKSQRRFQVPIVGNALRGR